MSSFYLLLNIFPQDITGQIILYLIGLIIYCLIAFQKVNHGNSHIRYATLTN